MSHDKINVIFDFSGLSYSQFHIFQLKILTLELLDYDAIAVSHDVARENKSHFRSFWTKLPRTSDLLAQNFDLNIFPIVCHSGVARHCMTK